MTKIIVISAINIIEGGALTVLRDCLCATKAHCGEDWKIVALVNNKNLVSIPGVEFVEYPRAKESWFIRLYYEWVHFYFLSRNIKPDLWFSLHDITPWVMARRRVVYCHNPSPFYKINLREAWLEPKFLLFNLFYRYLYKIQINKNDYVIVQQEWLRREFVQLFGINNIIVAYPYTQHNNPPAKLDDCSIDQYKFLYPTFPRVFKNLEVICEAASILGKNALLSFNVSLTINGQENRYASWLVNKYSSVPGLLFIGRLDRSQMMKEYRQCDCVIFPSRLETWGLPLTEAKELGKTIIASDMPYAHETVGNYHSAFFFNPLSASELAGIMAKNISENPVLSPASHPLPGQPFAPDWATLVSLIVQDL